MLEVDVSLLFLDVKGELLELFKLLKPVLGPLFATSFPLLFFLHILLSPLFRLPNIIPYKLLQNPIHIQLLRRPLTINTLLITCPFSHSFERSLLRIFDNLFYHINIRLFGFLVEKAVLLMICWCSFFLHLVVVFLG